MQEQTKNGRLMTLEEFLGMSPRAQGYVSYLQGDLPGSELKNHQHNPYEEGSSHSSEFAQGQRQAMLQAQDSED
jgi:hypothetical protein